MSGVNKAIIIGNLGKDPEVRYHTDGTAFATLSVATTYRWVVKDSGEQKEETEWHNISLRGKTAEVAGDYLKKGSPVYVEGRIRTRKWQDKEGKDRYTTEIVASSMQMLGQRNEKAEAKPKQKPVEAKPGKGAGNIADMEDDIPFVFDMNSILGENGMHGKSSLRAARGRKGLLQMRGIKSSI